MKVTTQELDNCEVILTVEIDDKQRNRLLENAARRISKRVRIPGFRPGKAPYRIVVNKLGMEAVQEEAMEDLTKNIFKKALEEVDVTPYAQASLDEIEWEPLTMKVKIPTNPVVELGNYRDMRLEFEEPEVTEEEIEEDLERLRDRQATYELVDRPAQLGDLVSVTVSEKDLASGEMVGEERDLEVTLQEGDEAASIPDLGVHVVGLAADEQTIWTHTYPEDYHREALAGKEVEVFARVNEVQEKEALELDDDFAALVGDYDTLAELREKIKRDLISDKQYHLDRELMPKVIERVLEEVKLVKWPPTLEEQEIDNALKRRERDLDQQGLDLQTYLQMQQQTKEELREELREDAQNSIKTSLVLGKVIELEKLEVDPEEVGLQAEFMAMFAGGTKEAERSFKSPAGLQVLANNLLYDRARSRLLQIAKGETEAAEEAAEVEPGEIIDGEASEVVEPEAEAAADVAAAADVTGVEATAEDDGVEDALADLAAAENDTPEEEE